MKSVFRALRDYFAFSKKDVAGFYVLIVLMGIILGLRIFIQDHPSYQGFKDEEFKKKILLIEEARRASAESGRASSEPLPATGIVYEKSAIRPFTFDPNKMQHDDWLRLGLTRRQAEMIGKYVAKGGKFRKKEDFRKLYCISDSEYEMLEPYIQIQPNEVDVRQENLTGVDLVTESHKKPVLAINLNTADSAALLQIRNIGPVFARRIIRYREKLGGFVNMGQLLEVYGMDSLRFKELEPVCYLEAGFEPRKINVNTSTVEQLSAHPYIDFYLAKSIVDYRIRRGRIGSLAELRDLSLMYEQKFQLVSPYLDIQ